LTRLNDCFRTSNLKNFFRRPTMVGDIFFFHFTK